MTVSITTKEKLFTFLTIDLILEQGDYLTFAGLSVAEYNELAKDYQTNRILKSDIIEIIVKV